MRSPCTADGCSNGGFCFQDNLKVAEQKELVVNEDYLLELGFVTNPAIYPHVAWKNTTLPVIVTYVLDDEHSQAIGLVTCAAKYLPDHAILVYSLGISDYQLVLVRHVLHAFVCCKLLVFVMLILNRHISRCIRFAITALVVQSLILIYQNFRLT